MGGVLQRKENAEMRRGSVSDKTESSIEHKANRYYRQCGGCGGGSEGSVEFSNGHCCSTLPSAH